MSISTILITLPDSDLAARIEQASGRKALVLSLDAAFMGDAISIATAYEGEGHSKPITHLHWQGHTLIDAQGSAFERILIERPLFSWPQPWCDRVAPLDPEEAALEVERLHAARSLTISALRILEDNALVANRPSLALLAATPAIALARLESAGVPVHPWTCTERDESTGSQSNPTRKDAAAHGPPHFAPALLGAERWVTAKDSAASAVQFTPGIDAGPLEEVLVVGGQVVAGGRDASITKFAVEAAQALDLVFAAITIDQTAGKVAWVDAAPDLAAWDRHSAGTVASALSDWLFSTALSAATPLVH